MYPYRQEKKKYGLCKRNETTRRPRKTSQHVTTLTYLRCVQEVKRVVYGAVMVGAEAGLDIDRGFKDRMARWVWIGSRCQMCKAAELCNSSATCSDRKSTTLVERVQRRRN